MLFTEQKSAFYPLRLLTEELCWVQNLLPQLLALTSQSFCLLPSFLYLGLVREDGVCVGGFFTGVLSYNAQNLDCQIEQLHSQVLRPETSYWMCGVCNQVLPDDLKLLSCELALLQTPVHYQLALRLYLASPLRHGHHVYEPICETCFACYFPFHLQT